MSELMEKRDQRDRNIQWPEDKELDLLIKSRFAHNVPFGLSSPLKSCAMAAHIAEYLSEQNLRIGISCGPVLDNYCGIDFTWTVRIMRHDYALVTSADAPTMPIAMARAALLWSGWQPTFHPHAPIMDGPLEFNEAKRPS